MSLTSICGPCSKVKGYVKTKQHWRTTAASGANVGSHDCVTALPPSNVALLFPCCFPSSLLPSHRPSLNLTLPSFLPSFSLFLSPHHLLDQFGSHSHLQCFFSLIFHHVLSFFILYYHDSLTEYSYSSTWMVEEERGFFFPFSPG